jgi:hypothetical protein
MTHRAGGVRILRVEIVQDYFLQARKKKCCCCYHEMVLKLSCESIGRKEECVDSEAPCFCHRPPREIRMLETKPALWDVAYLWYGSDH